FHFFAYDSRVNLQTIGYLIRVICARDLVAHSRKVRKYRVHRRDFSRWPRCVVFGYRIIDDVLNVWLRSLEQLAKPIGAVRANERIGILIRRHSQYVHFEAFGEQHVDRTHRCSLPRGVGIKVHDDLWLFHVTPQQPDLSVGQRGAETRDDVSDAFLKRDDAVEITFDKNREAGISNLAL